MDQQCYKHHKKILPGSEQHKNFVSEHYITCKCGYNNRKEAISKFGTCLRCKSILDSKAYLKYKLDNINNLSNIK